MSPPKMYQPPALERETPRCACGCGEGGSFGFPGPVHYAFRHWPDGFVAVDARGWFTGQPPAIAPREEAGAPASPDLFGLTEPAARLTNRPPGLTGRRRA